MKTINYILFFLILALFYSCADEGTLADGSGAVSGSYAKMLSQGDFLYLANQSELITYSISDRSEPVELNRAQLDFGLESVFIRKDLMFIGSTTQMYIYKIAATGIPEFLSTTNYNNWGNSFCFRDPIVTNDSIAFVTIATEGTTDGFCPRSFEVNELRMYDITDLESPELVAEFEMEEPKGLGLDGKWLFVCEKENGLRVFDVSDPSDLLELYHFPDFKTYDVIPLDGLLLVVGPDNLYQYDYSDMENMSLLSKIAL